MDAEDRVPLGFGDKRLHWSVRLRVKKWTGDRDLGHILFQDRRGLVWPTFGDGHGFGVPPPAEGYPARGPGVAHPICDVRPSGNDHWPACHAPNGRPTAAR
jgi:hypothetical protein